MTTRGVTFPEPDSVGVEVTSGGQADIFAPRFTTTNITFLNLTVNNDAAKRTFADNVTQTLNGVDVHGGLGIQNDSNFYEAGGTAGATYQFTYPDNPFVGQVTPGPIYQARLAIGSGTQAGIAISSVTLENWTIQNTGTFDTGSIRMIIEPIAINTDGTINSLGQHVQTMDSSFAGGGAGNQNVNIPVSYTTQSGDILAVQIEVIVDALNTSTASNSTLALPSPAGQGLIRFNF